MDGVYLTEREVKEATERRLVENQDIFFPSAEMTELEKQMGLLDIKFALVIKAIEAALAALKTIDDQNVKIIKALNIE